MAAKNPFVRMRRGIMRFREIHGLLGLSGLFNVMMLEKARFAPRSLVRLKLRPFHSMPVLLRAGTSDYSTLQTTFLQQYHLPHAALRAQATILDLGCNVGYTVMHFAHEYPDARIFGVEMDRDNYNLARINTAGYKNISLLHRAVSTTNGTVSYGRTAREDSYRISSERAEEAGAQIQVESMTIGFIIQELGIEHIDYLKMDIEGEEVRVLSEGLSDLSWLNIVDMLNIEVHTDREDLTRIMALLRAHNFFAWKENLHWSCVRAVKAEGTNRRPSSWGALDQRPRPLEIHQAPGTLHEADSRSLAE